MLSPPKAFSGIKKCSFFELGFFSCIKIINISHVAHYPRPYKTRLTLRLMFSQKFISTHGVDITYSP